MDADGGVVELDGTNGVSTMIVTFVVGEGTTRVKLPEVGGVRRLEISIVEKDGTVE
jgi:hypothetical protein